MVNIRLAVVFAVSAMKVILMIEPKKSVQDSCKAKFEEKSLIFQNDLVCLNNSKEKLILLCQVLCTRRAAIVVVNKAKTLNALRARVS